MEMGNALLWLCTGVTAAAIALYIVSAFDRNKLPLARLAYYAMTTGIVAVSIHLLQLLLAHEFNAQYVFSYSSRDLPLVYLISAFWAGQEGSILLWGLFGAIIGIVLAAKSKEYEPWVMAFWCSVQAFFLTMLLVKSPFAQTSAEMLQQFPDGQGLNPLLQNFWIAIHPPMLFVGYTAMAVPAAFVVAGLIRKDYDGWSNRCLPWAIFGWLTLGAGIILGSYWAYEVLGWGGYWGWDPVENASLIPWLAATALIHSMLVERYRGSMRKTNIALALVSFLLVIYATYLTRSGVLGDFSQHSFQATNLNTYLLGFLIFFTLVSVGLYAWRGWRAPSKNWYGRLASKEFAFFLGIIAFAIMALLVLWGTSTPLITGLLTKTAKNVPPEYYGLATTPVALVILLVLCFAPLLAWARREQAESVGAGVRVIGALLVLSLAISGAIALVQGPGKGVLVAVCSAAVLALLVNGWAAFRYGRGNWKMLGGYLTHLGIAMMFVGMVFSPSREKATPVIIPQGAEPVHALGYSFKLIDVKDRPGGGANIRLLVGKDGKSFVATVSFKPGMNGQTMAVPYIHATFLQDLYLEPSALRTADLSPSVHVTEQGTERSSALTPDGKVSVQLMAVGANRSAILLVKEEGKKPASLEISRGQRKRLGNYTFTFNGFEVQGMHGGGGESLMMAKLMVDYPGAGLTAVVDVTIKRLISLLWIGSILALAGGAIAIIRRAGENRKLVPSGVEQDETEVAAGTD